MQTIPIVLPLAAMLWAGCCQGWCEEDLGTGAQVLAVHGSGPADVWLSAADGSILRYDGEGFQRFKGAAPALSALWAARPGDLWGLSTTGVFVRYDGVAWRVSPGRDLLTDVAVTTGGEALAITERALCRLTEEGQRCGLLAPNVSLSALWAGTEGRVLVAGSAGLLFVRSGGAWAVRDLRVSSSVLKVTGDEVAWALLSDGSVVRVRPGVLEDDRWAGVVPPGEAPADIHAAGPDDAWALSRTKLRRLRAGIWDEVPLPLKEGLSAIWGAGPDDLWVVGPEGKVLHYLKER